MKNRLYVSAAFAAFAIAAMAGSVSQKKASRIAAQFFGGQQRSVKRISADADAGSEAYYVFNNTQGLGYVIVSGDDRMPSQIIGYSRSSNWPENDNLIPPALRDALGAYALTVRAVQKGEMAPPAGVIKKDGQESVIVDQLIKTRWGQGRPYNNEAPEMPHPEQDIYTSFGHYYIGCAATALGQILNYWRHVDSPAKRTSFYTIVDAATQTVDTFNVELEYDKKFDWENMPEAITYYPREGEDSAVWARQGKAVSGLLKNVAYSLNMSWSIQGGGGSSPLASPAAAMLDYGFTYDVTQTIWAGEGQLKSEVAMQLIKADLAGSRPVFVAGSTPTGVGHAFIFDGYDSKNYVHVNWGWEGSSDGWFDPGILLTSMGAFNLRNSIVTNLRPRDPDETLSVNNAHIVGVSITDPANTEPDKFSYGLFQHPRMFLLKSLSYLKNAGFDFDYLIEERYKDGDKTAYVYDTIAISSTSIDTRNMSDYIIRSDSHRLKNASGMHCFKAGLRARLGDKVGDWVMSGDSVLMLVKDNHYIINPAAYNSCYHAPTSYYYCKENNDNDYSAFSLHVDYMQNPKNVDVNDSLIIQLSWMYRLEKWFNVLNEQGEKSISVMLTKGNDTISVKHDMFNLLEEDLQKLAFQKGALSQAITLPQSVKFTSAGTYTLSVTLPAMNLEIKDEIIVTSKPTGVNDVNVDAGVYPESSRRVDADFDGEAYNTAGQQVGKDYKGIVIQKGKKYLNK